MVFIDEDDGREPIVASMADLSPAQRLVVWTGRCWVRSRGESGEAMLALGNAYLDLHMAHAVIDVHTFFSVLRAGARVRLQFGDVTCRCGKADRVGVTEALLVNCLACFHQGRPKCAGCVLKQWLSADAIAAAIEPARRWALVLAEQAFSLDFIPFEKPVPEAWPVMLSENRGANTVH